MYLLLSFVDTNFSTNTGTYAVPDVTQSSLLTSPAIPSQPMTSPYSPNLYGRTLTSPHHMLPTAPPPPVYYASSDITQGNTLQVGFKNMQPIILSWLDNGHTNMCIITPILISACLLSQGYSDF